MVPIHVNVLADHVTPVSLLSARWDRSRYCSLLESVEGGEKLGRYSIVSFEPDAVLEESEGRSVFKTPDGKIFKRTDDTALDALHQYFKCVKAAAPAGLPRFFGGAVGYAAYEAVHDLERLPKTKPDQLGWPKAVFLITNDLFVFDNTQQVLKIVVCERIRNQRDTAAAYRRAVQRIRSNIKLLETVRPSRARPAKRGSSSGFITSMERPAFMSAVRKAKTHIAAGDIIQVVLSRRSEKKTTASPLDIYRALRFVNPSPYMYVLKLDKRAVIGSSPESLIRLEDGVASTRPIAGTRRRGGSVEADERLKRDLLADPKEIAEHIMLVDLGRNDLGRVCQPGSVKVPTFMSVEKYSHVMHIVSEVTGRLKSKKDAFDLLKATFPAGTVSGAPKIRAMEIIDDLEVAQRGPYAGALGYVSYSGNMDMAITIRTILWDQGGRVSIQTGAGIVADSDPGREFQESENKAAAMKETLRLAESGRLR